MTIRVHISQPCWADTLSVFVVDHRDGMRLVLRMRNGSWIWDEYAETEAQATDIAPSMFLPHDSGRALLQALTEHFHGADDTRALRKDYDAERKRVDELTGVLSDFVRAIASATSNH